MLRVCSVINSRRECSVINCSRNFPVTKDVHFFRFPKDYERAVHWAEVCGLTRLLKKKAQFGFSMFATSYRVCSRHFQDSAFCGDTKKALHIDAVPTELLYNEGGPEDTVTLSDNDGQIIDTKPIVELIQKDMETVMATGTSEIDDQVVDLDEEISPTTDNFDCEKMDTTLLPESLQDNIKIEDTIVTNGIFDGVMKSEAKIDPTIDSTSAASILSPATQQYYILVVNPTESSSQIQPHQTSIPFPTTIPSQISEPSQSSEPFKLCYKCIDCGEKFERKGKLRLHRIDKHGQNRKFKCPQCPFRAFYFCDIKKHNKFAHNKSREKHSSTMSFKYECTSCNFRTNKKRYFLRHSLYHMTKVSCEK